MNPTVTFSKLGHHGRLGNQLFQVAAVLAYAKEYGHTPILPTWRCNYSGAHHGQYFPLVEKLATDKFPEAMMYGEQTYHYSEIPKAATDLDLFGYFQSSKHFLGHDGYIRKMLTPNIATKLVSDKCLAIHVRRGDYLTQSTNAPHRCLPLQYYLDAIALMDSFSEIRHINVFSDDLYWCRAQFKGDRFSFHCSDNPVADLAKMALHQRIIISNSSFSWWGAFLSHPFKIVVSPDRWFANTELSDKDVFEKNWIELPVIFER